MATEDRWHDFAKEKPSEDMEGRNFIVSNGHYEKIATWCGYWENEPFMGDRLCDEVVRWKFYFTPEEEKANEETCKELFVEESYNGGKYYDKDSVDALIAKKDNEIARLESNNKTLKLWYVNAKNAMHETEEACEAKDKDVAYWRKEYDEETKLTDALKAEIESLKASHYAESVDAWMRERRLRRSLWIARAKRALEKIAWFKLWNCSISTMNPEDGARQEYDKWKRNLGKFLKNAEEYK